MFWFVPAMVRVDTQFVQSPAHPEIDPPLSVAIKGLQVPVPVQVQVILVLPIEKMIL